MCLIRFCFSQMSFNARSATFVNVCVNFDTGHSKTRADGCGGIFGVDWPGNFFHCDKLFELIEVSDLARRLGTKVGGLGQMGSCLIRNVCAKRHLLDASAKPTAGGTAVSRVFRFFDESLIHKRDSALASWPE